jgi:hexokinase
MTDVLHSPGPVLAKFVANEHNALLLDGKRRELGFTFSFPVRQTSIACGTLTKRVNIDDAVSQYLVWLQKLSRKTSLEQFFLVLQELVS